MNYLKDDIKLDLEEIDDIHDWINQFLLSRPHGDLSKDFSDGVLIA